MICTCNYSRKPIPEREASPAIWDHTVLPATWHGWTHFARQAGARFT